MGLPTFGWATAAQIGSGIAGGATAGATSAAINGSNIGKGALYGGIIGGSVAGLSWGYTNYVGSEPTLAPGEDIPGGKYDANSLGQPPSGKNVVGFNQELTGDFWTKDFWTQGGPVSQALNFTPGGNAISAFHDTWMNNMSNTMFNNIATMAPSAAIAYGAQVGGQLSPLTVPFLTEQISGEHSK